MVCGDGTSASAALNDLVQLNFSIAVRAYCLAMQILAPWTENAAADSADWQPGRVFDAILSTRDSVAATMAELRLPWNPLPVSRFLCSLVGVLGDSLYYLSPAALRGYGPLSTPTQAYLAAWQSAVTALVAEMDQAAYGRKEDPPSGATETASRHSQPIQALTDHQRLAFGGALSSLAQTLLQIKAYGHLGLPPLYPVFLPSLTEEQLRYVLAAEQGVEACVEDLTATFGMAMPWTAVVRNDVLYACRDAAESLSAVSTAAWRQGHPQQTRLTELAIRAGRVQMLALNVRF
jgi:hypothetical protein